MVFVYGRAAPLLLGIAAGWHMIHGGIGHMLYGLLLIINDIANPACGVGAEFLAQLLLSELEIHVHALRTKSELGALGNNQAATTLMP